MLIIERNLGILRGIEGTISQWRREDGVMYSNIAASLYPYIFYRWCKVLDSIIMKCPCFDPDDLSAWTLVTAHDFHHSHLHVSFSDMQKNPKHMSGCAVPVWLEGVTLTILTFFKGLLGHSGGKKRFLMWLLTHVSLSLPTLCQYQWLCSI